MNDERRGSKAKYLSITVWNCFGLKSERCWSINLELWKTLKSIPSLVWAVTLTAICSARLRRKRRCYSTCCVPRPVLCMILRDEAKKSAQKSSEEAAIDVKLTVNLHFSSINCSGDNLCFIDPFQRYLKGKKWQINGVFENVLLGVLFWNSKFGESFQIFRKTVLQTVISFYLGWKISINSW